MENLDLLLNQYALEKSNLSEIESRTKKLNLEIKNALAKEGLDKYKTKDYIVSRTEINTDKLNEDLLISKIKEEHPDLVNQVIYKVEVLDLDKVEDLVYNRIIKADLVQSCVEHRKPTVRLSIRENKEE